MQKVSVPKTDLHASIIVLGTDYFGSTVPREESMQLMDNYLEAGGNMLDTQANPLATQMVSAMPVGGLGKHSQDELQSILAGHTVSIGLSSTPETFVSSAQTTPRDLQLQLEIMTAMVTDPGYRSEGEIQYRLNINNGSNLLSAEEALVSQWGDPPPQKFIEHVSA